MVADPISDPISKFQGLKFVIIEIQMKGMLIKSNPDISASMIMAISEKDKEKDLNRLQCKADITLRPETPYSAPLGKKAISAKVTKNSVNMEIS